MLNVKERPGSGLKFFASKMPTNPFKASLSNTMRLAKKPEPEPPVQMQPARRLRVKKDRIRSANRTMVKMEMERKSAPGSSYNLDRNQVLKIATLTHFMEHQRNRPTTANPHMSRNHEGMQTNLSNQSSKSIFQNHMLGKKKASNKLNTLEMSRDYS